MPATNMVFNLDTKESYRKKGVNYSISKLNKETQKISIKILYFDKKNEEKYYNSFTFYNLSNKVDKEGQYKWWKNNNNILRLGDIEHAIRENKADRLINIKDYTLRRYIFLHALIVAFPDFSDKSVSNSILNKIKKKYANSKFSKQKEEESDEEYDSRNIKFNICVYKDAGETNKKENSVTFLSLIDSQAYRVIKGRVSTGIDRAFLSKNPNEYLEKAINEKLRVRTGDKRDVTVLEMYNRIRRLNKNILEDYKNKDDALKDLTTKYNNFLNSLNDFKIKNEERIKRYKILRNTYNSLMDLDSETKSVVSGRSLFSKYDCKTIKKVIECCRKPLKKYGGRALPVIKTLIQADTTSGGRPAYRIINFSFVVDALFSLGEVSTDKITKQQNEIYKLKSENKELKDKCEYLTEQVAELKDKIVKQQEEIDKLKVENKKLKESVKELQSKLNSRFKVAKNGFKLTGTFNKKGEN